MRMSGTRLLSTEKGSADKMPEFTTFTACIRDDGTWDVTVDGATYHIENTHELKHFLEDIGI